MERGIGTQFIRHILPLFILSILVAGCAMPLKTVVLLRPDLKDHKWLHALEVKAPEVPFRFYESEADRKSVV